MIFREVFCARCAQNPEFGGRQIACSLCNLCDTVAVSTIGVNSNKLSEKERGTECTCAYIPFLICYKIGNREIDKLRRFHMQYIQCLIKKDCMKSV